MEPAEGLCILTDIGLCRVWYIIITAGLPHTRAGRKQMAQNLCAQFLPVVATLIGITVYSRGYPGV